MKHLPQIIYVSIILVFLFMIGCEKKPFNYRNKYLGDWKFNVKWTKFNYNFLGQQEQDSLTYTGEIKYGSDENEILIYYTSDDSINLIVDKRGELSNFPTMYCSGNFDGKEIIHLHLRWGGLGGYMVHELDGVKK